MNTNTEYQKHKEWEQKMYAKYPVIFQKHNLDMTQTCMCWGICVDVGWYDLIDTLCEHLQAIQKDTGIKIIAEQVKSKYAGLRFYYSEEIPDDIDESVVKEKTAEIRDLVTQAEMLSEHRCETCGVEATPKRIYGWIRVICPECEEKYYSRALQ